MKELVGIELAEVCGSGSSDEVKSLVANYCNSIGASDNDKVTITVTNKLSVNETVGKVTGTASTSSSTTYTMTCGEARNT
ncbi:hypothetical protein KO489_10015 [Reinekea forsetii]|nr:hypothetical protein [Reinekea forsetii]